MHESQYEDDREGNTPIESSIPETYPTLGTNAAIMRFRSLAYSLESYHPTLPHSRALFRIFVENVLPIIHVFHMPTLSRMFHDSILSLNSLDKNIEALLFSVYYSAIISLEPSQCTAALGITRDVALVKYRFAIEQALARADLLNTQSIILLQAAVLFLTALRNEDYSRTAWSLTSLVFHIAQTMGLHHDGSIFGLNPFETELRRRLWCHIVLLDNRSWWYHGSEPIIQDSGFDTQLPLNINDTDLTAEMTTSPMEREGACEMTFCRMRCAAIRADRKLCKVSHPKRASNLSPDEFSLKDKQILVEGLKTDFENHYIARWDPQVPYQFLCISVSSMIIKRLWLVVHLPLGRRKGADDNDGIQDKLFRTAIEILELTLTLLTNPEIAQWRWHSKAQVQWHIIAFVLSRICLEPSSPECDLAWELVCRLYKAWKSGESEPKGTMLPLIRTLMAKTKYVRQMRQMERTEIEIYDTAIEDTEISVQGHQLDKNKEIMSRTMEGAANTSAGDGFDTDNFENLLNLDSLDSMMELFPEDWHVEIFDAMYK